MKAIAEFMGKVGREIIETDIKSVIEDLRKAYALEWRAHYYLILAANIVGGIESSKIAEELKKDAEHELVHANRIAQRILELGSEPPRNLSEIEKILNEPKMEFPKNTNDIKGFLRVFLELERHAIKMYHGIYKKTHDQDVVTHELIEDLLKDEVADEEKLENLLGE